MHYTIPHQSYECLIAKASQRLRIAAYDMLWPNHCKSCDASGHEFIEKGLLLLGEETAVRECRECISRGRCPRCGVSHIYDDERYYKLIVSGICDACGWIWSEPLDHKPAPEWTICRCFGEGKMPVFEVQVFSSNAAVELEDMIMEKLSFNPDFVKDLMQQATEGEEEDAEEK